MDTVITQKRNGYELIVDFGHLYVDPEATKKRVRAALDSGIPPAEIVAENYLVRFPPKHGEHPIGAATRAGLKQAIEGLPPFHVLTIDGEIVHRLDTMTPAEIATEREGLELAALNNARELRSGLEIQGDADALSKSQESYKIEMQRIEQMYTRERGQP
jgi:hypothetical protein